MKLLTCYLLNLKSYLVFKVFALTLRLCIFFFVGIDIVLQINEVILNYMCDPVCMYVCLFREPRKLALVCCFADAWLFVL